MLQHIGCPGTSGNVLGYCGFRDYAETFLEYLGTLYNQGHGHCYDITVLLGMFWDMFGVIRTEESPWQS